MSTEHFTGIKESEHKMSVQTSLQTVYVSLPKEPKIKHQLNYETVIFLISLII